MRLRSKTKMTAGIALAGILIPSGVVAILRAETPGSAALPAGNRPVQNTVQVTTGGDLTANEIAAIMGVTTWNLNVSLPPDTKWVSVELEQRRKDREPLQLVKFGTRVDSDKPHRMVVGIFKDSSGKTRIMINGFNGTTGTTGDDPFPTNAPGFFASSFNPPLQYPDGAYALEVASSGSMSRNGDADMLKNADSALVLKITPQTPP